MSKEVLELARGILCAPYHDVPLDDVLEAIDKALAQPEQEPVAWRVSYQNDPELGFWFAEGIGGEGCLNEPLYTTPPQRKPLTKEQRIQIVKDNTIQGYHGDYFDAWGIIDDVEAAHGIKE